jgi:SAM-dependent methyltransferase
MLPGLLSQLFTTVKSASSLTVTELGAGTGRNTIKLLQFSTASVPISRINALDLSPGMLEVGRQRCDKYFEANATTLAKVPKLEFYQFDALNPSNFPDLKNLEGTADIVLSTLVLEHLPIDIFFRTAKSLLKNGEGGYLILTNMHAAMGRIGQAGFVDEETGEKIRGDSYNYEIEEVLAEGKKWGFNLEGSVGERAVREEDIGEGRLLGPRGRKWIGVKVWFGMVMRVEG